MDGPVRCPLCGAVGYVCSHPAPLKGPPVGSVYVVEGEMAKDDYVAEKRMYVNADGAVVGDDDPEKLTLIAGGPGARIPYARAVELGLVEAPQEAAPEEDAEPEGKAQGGPPQNKARSGAASK